MSRSEERNEGSAGPKAAYAAAIWAFVFAGITYYWALGGTAGASTVGSEITGLAKSDWAYFSIVLWADAIAKTLLGLLALALVQSWGKAFSSRFLFTSSWVIGFLMAAYGAIQLAVTGVSALLMTTGVIGVSPSVDWVGIVGHLAIWDPYWLVGGVLFILAARSFRHLYPNAWMRYSRRRRNEPYARLSAR